MHVETREESRSGTIMVELIEGDESWVERFHHCCRRFPKMGTGLSPGLREIKRGRIPEERTALSRLCLEENLGHHELAFFLVLVVSEVVLVHHPVGFLGFPLLPVVGVENQYFLVAFHHAFRRHRPRLPGLVPPGFVPVHVRVHFPSLSCARGIGFGWSVKKVPD